MKKILLSCACCLLAVGLLAGCDEDVEEVNPEEPSTTVPSTGDDDGGSETTYLFGFELDGTLQYIDGGLVEYNGAPQSNEGAYTDDVSKAAAISCEVSGSTYYLSFDNEGVTNWITIVSGDHPNLSYANEKSPIYLHTTDGGAEYFGDEEGNYFLSYNATYKCVYASSVSSWLTSSPVCGLYTTDGKLVAGGKGEEPAPAIEPVLGTIKEGEYFLGVTMSEVTYYFDGTLSGYYGSVSPNGYDAAVVTVAAATDGYTLSIGESDDTQYLYAYVANGYVDFGLQSDPFTWQYDTTFETFVVELNDQWNFIGTYGTNQRLGMNDYGYLTGDKSTNNAQYAAKLFDVITYVAPTSITVSGETSVEVGGRITLTATPSIEGEDVVDPRVTWSSTEPTIATVSEAGVVRGVATGTTSIVATSVKDSTVSGSLSITVVEASGETVVYKLGALDSANYTYRWFNGTANGSGLNTTTEWDDAADVYIDAVESDLDNACTLSFYDSDDELKYISATSSGTSASIADTDNPCTWVWDETYGVFALGHTLGQTGADRFLCFYATNNDFRAYAGSTDNLNNDPHVTAYTTQPANPERPEPTAVTISGLTNVEVDKTIHLTAAVEPEGALQDVTWTSSDTNKATIDDDGYVTGVAVTSDQEYVTITATSTANTSISGTYQITVSEAVVHTEVEIGTYDFTSKDETYDTSTGVGTGAYSSVDALKATFDAYWTSTSEYTNPLTKVNSTSIIYNYYTSGGLHANEHGLLKTGTSSANGTINITVNTTITKVVIDQQSWSTSENCTITVNSVSKESASKGVQESLTFDIEESTDLDMTFAKRCYIFSITLYGYVD